MKLAEKIYERRKLLNLSQEQFAEKLCISRQAVSKWESGQSMPDLDKIIAMSELFGVSTDYLLKDDEADGTVLQDDEADGTVPEEESGTSEQKHLFADTAPEGKLLSKEEVQRFLLVRRKAAFYIALGVLLCIISTAVVVLGTVISGQSSEESGLYVVVMFLLIAVAVGLFVYQGLALSRLHEDTGLKILLPDSFRQEIKEQDVAYQKKFAIYIVAGVMLCVGSVIPPLTVGPIFTESEQHATLSAVFLLCMVAVGVFLFVRAGITKSTYDILLGRKKTPAMEKKEEDETIFGAVIGMFWCLITATYLVLSFFTAKWEYTWIIWPVAGLLCGGLSGVAKAMAKNRKE